MGVAGAIGKGVRVACLALALCAPAAAQDLLVYAAASLKESLDEVAAQYARGGERVRVSYFASSALAKQIERGAPADVFVSADLDWMDYLERRGLLRAGTRRDLLHNGLVLIAPADSRLQLAIEPGFALAAALGAGRLAMADPDSVPAGRYGRTALEKLGAWQGVAARVVRGDNVRTALNFVARGEAPLGIVYETDARAERRVRIVGVFPPASHPRIVYPAAVVAASRHPAAQPFLAYLASSGARTVFGKYGFTAGH